VKVDTDAQKTTEVALSAINFQKFLDQKPGMFKNYTAEVMYLIEFDNQHILEAIEFKAFCDVFFNEDENVRKKAWLQISSSQPNFEQLVKFVQRATNKDDTRCKMIHEDVLVSNVPLKNAIKSFLLESAQYGSSWMLDLPDSLKKDKDFVLKVIRRNKFALEYVHEDLKKDKDIVIAALQQRPKLIKYYKK
jgi:hypothetical protein